MNLIKQNWTNEDIKDFYNYLNTFSKGEEKSIWQQRIINTKLKCIAVPSPTVNEITKQIAKGNFLSFVEKFPWENWTVSMIVGSLICLIEDFETLKKHLYTYACKVDNWANCDGLKFRFNNKNKDKFFDLGLLFIKDEKPFVRRIGLIIFFKMLRYEEYLEKIFTILNGFHNEEHYYVNMMLAWIVCECFIKYRDKTKIFLQNHKLNKFVINKAISKCRDSFRVSNEDKQMLLQYKIK